MKIILDYSDFIEAKSIGYSPSWGSGYLEIGTLGYCPFCKVQSKRKTYKNGTGLYGDLYRCDCGWWDILLEQSGYGVSYNESGYEWKRQYRSILKTWDVSDYGVPLHILNNYIVKNHDSIFNIHYTKMEELVKSVFENHFNCEVKHIGGSGDGGIDLFIIEKDGPIAVQVKRRMKKNKSEPVTTVRSLIGAIQLNDFQAKKAKIVSTAMKFTTPAKEAANKAVHKNILDEFELIDFPSFVSMLNLAEGKIPEPWSPLKPFFNQYWLQKEDEWKKSNSDLDFITWKRLSEKFHL